MHKITRKLIDEGHYKLKDGHILQAASWPNEKVDIVANMKSTEKGVIVLGQPKTGNHLTMAILDALGVDRAEELDKVRLNLSTGSTDQFDQTKWLNKRIFCSPFLNDSPSMNDNFSQNRLRIG